MFAHVSRTPGSAAQLRGPGRGPAPRVVSAAASAAAALYDPRAREARYGGNVAQYLVDCHDTAGTSFNFCGGMKFGLVLSDALRAHLGDVAAAGEGDPRQPRVFAGTPRMALMDGYERGAGADDVTVFHGREVRQVTREGLGETSPMFIHLSLSGGGDPEGWSAEEVAEYSGWLSDRQRRWRDGAAYAAEKGGADWYRAKFGEGAYGLHHRFYLRTDEAGGFWLSAEDGCEGVAMEMGGRRGGAGGILGGLFG